MAPVNRRPATRQHPSPTQEELATDADAYPPFDLDDRNDYSINEESNSLGLFRGPTIDQYRPQLDNPSQMLPGDDNDVDTALEQYLSTQEQDDEQSRQAMEEEYSLEIPSDDDDDAADDNAADEQYNIPYTQGTLDAASVLAAGFNAGANNNNEEEEEELEPTTEENTQQQPTTNLAASIAAQLRTHGLTNSGLQADELQFVADCDEGKNTTQYDNTKKRLEIRFFDTLEKCGGAILSKLATEKIPNPHDLHTSNCIDHSFYAAVAGEKDADKHEILNKCFILCGMKWECLTGERKGQAIQPVSFVKMMQQLTYVFQEKGVLYLFNEDFNKKGEFHGVMKKRWRDIRKKDPSFGTGSKRARVEKTLVRKFFQAIRDKRIRPFEDPEHCLVCVIFIIGYCCGLRGSKEHIDLDTTNVYLGEYTLEDGPELAGLKWGGVKVPFSKTNNLNMNKTWLPRDKDVMLTFVETPEHDCFDPYAIFVCYIRHCHPRAKKFYGRLVKQGDKLEGGKLAQEFSKPVWYAESGHGRTNWNLGPDKHRSLCKQIAQLAGVEHWNQCTGHALRALCITHCIASNLTAVDVAAKVRHSSTNTQKDYAHDCPERKANRVLCMTDKPRKRPAQEQVIADDVVVVETQPMLPQNRALFKHATKKRFIPSEEEKENKIVSIGSNDLDNELIRLQKENEILRLQKENQRMKEELTGSATRRRESPPDSAPRRHGRSFPPSNPRHEFDDGYHYQQHDSGYRRSYPPPPPRGPPRHHLHHTVTTTTAVTLPTPMVVIMKKITVAIMEDIIVVEQLHHLLLISKI